MQIDSTDTPARGKFIVFEGIDGAGKSTQLDAFCASLRTRLAGTGKQVIVTREPGGTALGEDLRAMLLHRAMHIETEALLMFAARREHIAQVIEPALARGDWVVSDRFTDATFAYQGGGRGMPAAQLDILETWVQGNLRPDLIILLDLPVETARARSLSRAKAKESTTVLEITHASMRSNNENPNKEDAPSTDKFESESCAFFSRIRNAYLTRAAKAPDRYLVVNAEQSVEEVRHKLACCLQRLIGY